MRALYVGTLTTFSGHYQAEPAHVYENDGVYLGRYEWNAVTETWDPSGIDDDGKPDVLAVPTDAALALLEGDHNGQQAITTGATVAGAMDGGAWSWDDYYSGSADADHLKPGSVGAWVRNDGIGGGTSTLTGDAVTVSPGVTRVEGIRGNPVASGTLSAGNVYRTSPAAGLPALGVVEFSALTGTIAPGTKLARGGVSGGLVWTVQTAPAPVGGVISAVVTGPGSTANLNAGSKLVIATRTIWTGSMKFAATSGAIPVGTLIRLANTTQGEMWRVTAATGIVSGYITCTVQGALGAPNGEAVTLQLDSTLYPGITLDGTVDGSFGPSGGQMRFAATGGLIPRGFVISLQDQYPGVYWVVLSSTGIVGGFITCDVCGTAGLYSGAAVTITTQSTVLTGVTTTGSCITAFGLSAVGVVDPDGIVGGTDALTAKDITGARVLNSDTYPNGDARTDIFPGGAGDSAPGINTLLASARPGDTVRLRGTLRVKDSIDIDKAQGGSAFRAFKIEGYNNPLDGGDTVLLWDTTVKKPIMRIASDRMVIEGIAFNQSAAPNTPISYIDVGRISGPTSINFNVYRNLRFENSYGSTAGTGVLSQVRINPAGDIIGGQENQVWEYCFWTKITGVGYEVASGSQPYSQAFSNCAAYGLLDSNAMTAAGCFLYSRNQSSSYSFHQSDIQSMEMAAWVTRETRLSFSQTQIELVKKLLWVEAGSRVVVTSDGALRFATGALNYAGLGPHPAAYDSIFARENEDYVTATNATVLKINGLDAGGTGEEQPKARIRVGRGTAVYLSGIIHPARDVVARDTPVVSTAITEVSGICNGGTLLGFVPLNESLNGANNSSGSIMLHETEDEQIVQLPSPEADGVSYIVMPWISGQSSGSVASSPSVEDQTGSQFKIRVKDAPGAGEHCTVSWSARKGRRVITSPTEIEATPALWLRSTHGVTEAAGTASVWTDVAGRVFNYAGSQPAYSAADANLGGLPSITFTNSQSMVSALAASDWAYMVNLSSPFTLMAVVYHPLAGAGDNLNTCIGCKTESGTAVGASLCMDHPGPARAYLRTGDGSVSGGISSGSYAYTPGKRFWCAAMSGNAQGPGYSKTSVDVAPYTENASYGGFTFSTSKTPAVTFTIRNGGTGTQNLSVAEVLMVKRYLSFVELDALFQGYFVPRYKGLVSP